MHFQRFPILFRYLEQDMVNRGLRQSEGFGVLALLGLFGVLAAGVAADVILSPRDTQDSEEDTDSRDDDGQDLSAGNLLDQDQLDGLPESDDLEEPTANDVRVDGTEKDDLLSGDAGNDSISGDGGDDQVDGRAGDDWIDAGDGDDAVWGGAGSDTIAGGAGDDSLQGQTATIF
jgi:Ca2+-binding RTX toxin-like protein